MVKRKSDVLRLLIMLEEELQRSNVWPIERPEESAFLSIEPFALDYMSAEQWLLWVFIPKILILIENDLPLPTRIALTPYFDEALREGNEALLSLLQQCDDLLNQE